MNLGDLISSAFTGAPVDREGAFDAGQNIHSQIGLRSAQTESAFAEARVRRAAAQKAENEQSASNTLADDLITKGGVDPHTAQIIAAGNRSGLGNLDQLTQGTNNIATGGRAALIADPTANPMAVSAARAAQAPGTYQRQRVEGGMLLDDATHTAVPTEVGQAQIDKKPAGSAGGPMKFHTGPGGVLYVETGDPTNPVRLATPIEQQVANAQAAVGGTADAKTLAKLRADLPKAKAVMHETDNDYDEVNQLVSTAMNDPNLWQTTGLTKKLSEIPGTEGVKLRSLLQTLKYRLGFSSLQNLRAMSPTGGALGNVSDAEGQWLQNAIVPLSNDMSTGDFREILGSLGQFTQNAKARRRQAYNETFAGIDKDIPVAGPAPPGQLRPDVAPLAPQARVFNLPPVNNNGWHLMKDADGNRAYVNPKDSTQFEEVK